MKEQRLKHWNILLIYRNSLKEYSATDQIWDRMVKEGGGDWHLTNLCRYVDLLIGYLSCVVDRINFISR